jgi:hypothetical protein
VDVETDLHQRPLYLTIRAGALGESSPADGVDLIHKDHAGLMVTRITKHLAHYARGFANVLVNDGGGDDLEKVGIEGRGDRAGQECLARSRRTIEKHAFWGSDPDALEEFGIEEGELNDLREAVENTCAGA